MKIAIGIPFYFACLVTLASSTCYFPNGDEIQDSPCNSTATHSTCCGPGYACLSNNLCALTEHVSSDVAKLSPFYVRASCTDPTWTSTKCPLFCRDASDNLGKGGMGVGKCDGAGFMNRYYCRNSVTASFSDDVLCTNASYYFDFEGFPTTVTIIGVGPTPTTSSKTPPPSSTSERATQTPNSSSSKDKEKIAIGLGTGLGIPLFLALTILAYVIVLRSRPHRAELSAAKMEADGTTHSSSTQWSAHRLSPVVCELGSGREISEAPISQAHELSAKATANQFPPKE